MAASLLDEVVITRLTVSGTLTAPANTIGGTSLLAADPVPTDKARHRFMPRLAQVHGSSATAERRVVHRARAAGTLIEFKVGVAVAATGDSTVTVDLRKNGTTILNATLVIDNGDVAYTGILSALFTGGVTTIAYASGDVFEVVITVSAGTGTLPQGLFCIPVFDENPT